MILRLLAKQFYIGGDGAKLVVVALVVMLGTVAVIPLEKRANGKPLITIEYHSVSFSTIGAFNGI